MRQRTARRRALLRLVVSLPALTTAAPVAAAPDAVQTITLSFGPTRETAEPRLLRARMGDRIRLEVITGRSIVVHVHGLGIEIAAAPDRPGSAAFTATATGRFPIHVHEAAEPPQARRHHRAPYAYLEVYPK